MGRPAQGRGVCASQTHNVSLFICFGLSFTDFTVDTNMNFPSQSFTYCLEFISVQLTITRNLPEVLTGR